MSGLDDRWSDRIATLSDELALIVDRVGVVRSSDQRARQLGLEPGVSLCDRVNDGSREKLERLLDGASASPGARHEISLGSRPLAVRAQRFDDEILLVGTLLVPGHDDTITELAKTMTELGELYRVTERQRDELAQLNRELTESNNGLRSLHAELDEQGAQLRRMTDVRGRVVASVSHEFRTPLHTILGIAKLLRAGTDGPLNTEQQLQLDFILSSAQNLHALVDDLLDLSKLDAGKTRLRPVKFAIDDVLSALRGTMRPIVQDADVQLIVEDANDPEPLETDEGKIGQILRNLVSNALKFTTRGEVRVRARRDGAGTVSFVVQDTGIGIAPSDQARIFEEFEQIDSPRQRQVHGTGLGLALSRRLASLLGGELTVESRPGEGAVFTLRVPAVHVDARAMNELEERSVRGVSRGDAPVLVVEDNRQTLFLYEKYLATAGFQVLPARTIADARAILARFRPAAVVLDVLLEGESTWTFLSELKGNPATAEIPVMVVTIVDRSQKARALGADEFWLKPVDPERLLRKLREVSPRGPTKILVIDDDPAARYVIRKLLRDTDYQVLEASNGPEGLKLANAEQPQLILLDFMLGDHTAFDVLDDLKGDAMTRNIPVILQTAKDLSDEERERLARETAAIVQKQNLTRELAISRIREALHNAGVGLLNEAG